MLLPDLIELAGQSVDAGDQTVPIALFGAWRRNWISFGDDGEREAEVAVIWLQTASGMGDVRIDPARPAVASDSSCGITLVDETTRPHMTAEWLSGDTGFAQQSTPSFPEKGWLVWQRPDLMLEIAPSGAYVEEWERLPQSNGVVAHFAATDSATCANLYVAGHHVFLAVRRSAGETLDEYSYGVQSPAGNVEIKISTIASKIGAAMALDIDWRLVSSRRW